jgi:palmitoyltransferase
VCEIPSQWWLLTLFGVWLLVMIVFNYVLTVITHPGVAPNPAPTALRERVRLQMPPPLAIQGDEDHLPPREGGEFSAVHERTGRWKPPRAHFDALSGEIVLKFDHYCPWVANAIGWGNQKYFVGFLVWMMAGCAFAAALALPGFLGAGQFQPEALELPAEAARLPHRPLKHFSAHAAFAFVLPASIGTAMVLFGSWHVFLLFTNQTTIEFFHNIKRRKRALMLGFVSRWEVFVGIAMTSWGRGVTNMFGSVFF